MASLAALFSKYCLCVELWNSWTARRMRSCENSEQPVRRSAIMRKIAVLEGDCDRRSAIDQKNVEKPLVEAK